MTKKSWRQRCLDNPDMMFKRALNSAKNRATNRVMPFNITVEYLVNLFSEQGGRCFYSGLKMNVVKKDAGKTHDPFKMTLDCIDPKKGYVPGNIVWCSYCVNSMKQKMPLSRMLQVCSAISERSELVKSSYKKIRSTQDGTL